MYQCKCLQTIVYLVHYIYGFSNSSTYKPATICMQSLNKFRQVPARLVVTHILGLGTGTVCAVFYRHKLHADWACQERPTVHLTLRTPKKHRYIILRKPMKNSRGEESRQESGWETCAFLCVIWLWEPTSTQWPKGRSDGVPKYTRVFSDVPARQPGPMQFITLTDWLTDWLPDWVRTEIYLWRLLVPSRDIHASPKTAIQSIY